MDFPLSKEAKEFFIKEKKGHVRLVNHFARILGTSFPEHDQDKFSDPELSMLAPRFWKLHHSECLWRAEWDELEKQGIKIHQSANPHHAEFWRNIDDMSEEAIVEMCCDWRAVAAQRHPHNIGCESTAAYYRSVALPKYKFSAEQQRLIESTLKKLARER